ncbi:MAG: hypothetical protein ACOWWM_06790 [Desulfobacterales bacterium]
MVLRNHSRSHDTCMEEGGDLGKRQWVLIIVFLSLTALAAGGFVIWRSGSGPPEPIRTPGTGDSDDGFTFFDIDAKTPLSDQLRDALKRRLGSDAIAYRMPFNIEFNRRAFLKEHFPNLFEVNSELNAPFGERREHDTVSLTYRRAQRMQVPFNYVELVFSNATRLPLFFKIEPAGVGPQLLDTLKEKYGDPQTIRQNEANAWTHWWEADSDYLIVTVEPDRFGDPRYRFFIIFTRNIEELIASEKTAGEQIRSQRRKAGESAF